MTFLSIIDIICVGGDKQLNTINERIKHVRKNILKISQQELAEKIGVSQNAISWSEKPNNNVSDSTIKSICTLFNINEDYLRHGTEPIFIESDTFDLNKFIDEQGGTELEKEIIRTYFELPEDIRKTILEHFKQKFGLHEKSKGKPMTVAEMQTLYDSIPDTPTELERLGKDDENNAV